MTVYLYVSDDFGSDKPLSFIDNIKMFFGFYKKPPVGVESVCVLCGQKADVDLGNGYYFCNKHK
jgi:hypothetical protein